MEIAHRGSRIGKPPSRSLAPLPIRRSLNRLKRDSEPHNDQELDHIQ
ncbi:hypothetical protein RRSWK_02140 [Rhodopirellula sp. SWK7]|nr:hypothetical protein RRSWK_02140 [Rhodopirellula sp. SWK7]